VVDRSTTSPLSKSLLSFQLAGISAFSFPNFSFSSRGLDLSQGP